MHIKKLLTAVAILMATLTNAQDAKEGSVTYVMTMEGLPPEQAAMMGDMEMKMFFKDKKVFSETTSMMFTSKTLVDDKGFLMCMDQMGNKQYLKMTKEEMEKKAAEKKEKDKTEPKIEYTNETKTIAGYECKKAIVTVTSQKDGEVKNDVWYTEKIPYVSNGGGKTRGGDPYAGIKGMLMEYSMAQGPMKIKLSAKEVSLDKVPDSKFELSTEGYTEMKAPPGGGQAGGK